MKLKLFKDYRGIFYEIYNKKRFYKFGIRENFVQDNISISKKNVLRGMHYTIQKPQSQLLTLLEGEIFDCLVDLRKKSKFFGKYFSFYLNAKKNNQIYMPAGVAHGFCVLSKQAILHYNSSRVYDPDDEGGLIWNDKSWTEYINTPGVFTYILQDNEDLVGYFEQNIHFQKHECEIAYFGILEEYIGKKIGAYLLSEAIKKSFATGSKRIWVHTCSLDHEHALDNYLSRGMKVFKSENLSL